METTLSVDSPFGVEPGHEPVWGLQIAWCFDEPERVGQIFLLRSDEGEIGRGPGEGAVVRMNPSWVRGSRVRLAPQLTTRRVSRRQLVVRDGATLRVENVGKTELRVGGHPVRTTELQQGDVIELDSSLVLLVVRCGLDVDVGRPAFPFGAPGPMGLIGESDVIWALRSRLRALRSVSGHVLIRGPSGAGKELAAGTLRRGSGPWVARSAATIPPSLAAAELFGNRRDYPNAGMPDRPGLVGEADGGVLYLDEIGELPESVQTALLRVMDHGEYQRVGEAHSRTASLTIVGATNQPLDRLRADLVARFRHRVAVPGLEERRGDIPLLLSSLLRSAREDGAPARFFRSDPVVTPRFVRWLLKHRYTTHVRELDQLIWASMDGSPTEFLDVPATVEPEPESSTDLGWEAFVGQAPDRIPPPAVQACLDAHNGSQEETWRALGLSSRHVLRRFIRRHGLVVRRRSDA